MRAPISYAWLGFVLAACGSDPATNTETPLTGGVGAMGTPGTGGEVATTGGEPTTSWASPADGTGASTPVGAGSNAGGIGGSLPAAGTGGSSMSGTGGSGPGNTGGSATGGISGSSAGGAGNAGSDETGGVPTGGTGSAGSDDTGGSLAGGTGSLGPDETGGRAAGGTEGGAGSGPDGTGGVPTGGSGGIASGGTGSGGSVGGSGGSLEAGAAGDGGSEPPPPEEVRLVTSGPGAYWQVGELIEGGGSPTLTINQSQTNQEWIGFGGTFNEAGWEVMSLLSEQDRELALRLLFDPHEGCNFAWGRIPMGASDFAMNRYSLSETPDDFAMDGFSIERDRQYLIPFIKAALTMKADLRLWASPWSPPAWMKANGDMNGGRIREEPQVLEAYALYFARFIEEYAAEGLEIEHIQPQNEPGYETRYPSCLWTPELLRDFVRDNLGPTLAERELDTEIWFGTMSAPEDTQHIDAVLADGTAAGYVKGFGLQWNTMSSTSQLASRGYLVMQTEHKCGNYPWESATFNPDRPPNDHAYAVESWGLIRDWIKAGVNAYSAWNMVLDTQGQNLDEQRPWPQNALLTVDRATGTLTPTPAYYVFRHLSQYVDPGAVRVGTSGSADALAFKNPDGGLVVIMYNSGGQPAATTLDVGGSTVQFQVPAQGWATVNWQ